MSKRETIGKMDRRITFQSETFSRNQYNEPESTGWQNVVTTSAHVLSSPGNETYIADQITVVNTTSFVIRYRTNINEKMRLVFDNRVYKIASITEPAGTRRKYLQVKAELIYEAEP